MAMTVTMVVSGLWHGAAWTFVLWGVMHATVLAVERVTGLAQRTGPWSRPLTLGVVLLAWVVFRAESADQAQTILSVMLGLQSGQTTPLVEATFAWVPITLLAARSPLTTASSCKVRPRVQLPQK